MRQPQKISWVAALGLVGESLLYPYLIWEVILAPSFAKDPGLARRALRTYYAAYRTACILVEAWHLTDAVKKTIVYVSLYFEVCINTYFV